MVFPTSTCFGCRLFGSSGGPSRDHGQLCSFPVSMVYQVQRRSRLLDRYRRSRCQLSPFFCKSDMEGSKKAHCRPSSYRGSALQSFKALPQRVCFLAHTRNLHKIPLVQMASLTPPPACLTTQTPIPSKRPKTLLQLHPQIVLMNRRNPPPLPLLPKRVNHRKLLARGPIIPQPLTRTAYQNQTFTQHNHLLRSHPL